MANQFHEFPAACLIGGFNQNCPDRVYTEGLSVLLLLLDEVVVAAKLFEHVGHDHAASVSLVAEVREFVTFGAICESQREERIRFHWHALRLIDFLPKELSANF